MRRFVLLRSALLAIGIFAGLMAVWPAVGPGYGAAFRAGGNLFFGFFGHDEIEFRPNLRDDGHDVAVYVDDGARVDGVQHYWGKSLTSHYLGYVPTVIFLALALATPVAWNRRLRCLLWGGLLLYAFIVARVVVLLVYEANFRAGAPDTWWATPLHHLHGLMNQEPTIYALVPLLIWAVVLLRRRDLDLLRPADATPEHG